MKKLILFSILVAGIATGCAKTVDLSPRTATLYRFKVMDLDSTVTYSRISAIQK